MLNINALFCDGTRNFRNPCEPKEYDTVKLRFRTGKDNVDEVCLVTQNKKIVLGKADSDKLFDYYEVDFALTNETITYYFEIHKDSQMCFYNGEGAVNEIHPEFNFVIIPGFSTPDWAKGAVFYQIYVDRFCNGDTTNDVEDNEYCYVGEKTQRVKDWYKYPASIGIREFYGGDLQGVMDKLDYLQNLGVEVIYLNPIFVSPSNHKYDIQDYDYVDPHFGVIAFDGGEPLPQGINSNHQASKYIQRVTDIRNLEASNELFIRLVEEIHKRGMKIILDGVFNHCGSFNKWLDREGIYELSKGYEKGAYVDKESPYHSFFRFKEDKWPYNASYDGWWGYDTLPKLNYEGSTKLYDYIMDIARKWVSSPFNCDGWRLDVAADLGYSNEYNHKFWKEFRRNVKEANPQALILAEHYGNPKQWLKGDEWDSVMNYDAFMEPLTWFLTGLEKHSDEYRGELLGQEEVFFETMRYHMASFYPSSLQVAMNELSNHDHSRFLTRTNKTVGRTATKGPEAAEQNINKGIMRAAVVIQMTWPGAPTIYYGDEAGVCGWTDPDNRRTYPWGREDYELIELHKDMIQIHKSYEALKTGSIIFLTGEHGFISYGRFDQTDKFIVAVNMNSYEFIASIHAWEVGITEDETLSQLMFTTEGGYTPEAVIYHVEAGILQLTMPPVSSVVIKNITSSIC